MAIRIEASVVNGLGWASGRSGPFRAGTIVLQRPLLAPYFPEIAGCFDGTINLLLDEPVQIGLPDIVTPPLAWDPDQPGFDERFGLTAIGFEFGGQTAPAWIYTAEKSPHRSKSGAVELLAAPVAGIVPGARCAIHLPRAERAALWVA